MAHGMTEEDLMRELEIDDWRHMTKDKIVGFASNLHKLDPEVAKKVIEQIPDFVKFATGVVEHYKEIIEQVLSTHSKGSQEYYNMCNAIIESLKAELNRDDMNYEKRREITNIMITLSDKVAMKNKEDQNFLLKTLGYVTAGILGFVGIVVTIFGAASRDDDKFDT